jgi:hypothetical protein
MDQSALQDSEKEVHAKAAKADPPDNSREDPPPQTTPPVEPVTTVTSPPRDPGDPPS